MADLIIGSILIIIGVSLIVHTYLSKRKWGENPKDATYGAHTWLECEEGFLMQHRIWDEDFNYLHTADLVLNDAGIPTRCGDARINVKESVATGSLSGGV